MKLKSKKVRKNITLSKEAEEKLKELARIKDTSQSELIEELINEVYKKIEKKKKLEALKRIVENRKYFEGIDPNITIQKSRSKWEVNYKRVFVDGNVILDYFLKDRPFSKYSEKAIDYFVENNVQLLTNCDLITTVYYVLRKYNKQKALENLSYTLELLYLIPFSNEETEKAIKLIQKDKNFKDLEDTLQYILAKENECDLILSNDNNFFAPDIKKINTKDFIS